MPKLLSAITANTKAIAAIRKTGLVRTFDGLRGAIGYHDSDEAKVIAYLANFEAAEKKNAEWNAKSAPRVNDWATASDWNRYTRNYTGSARSRY